MYTHLIEIAAETPDDVAIEQAAEAIRAGKVVAIPTDTLYVMVADPFSLRAVASVYAAKGREPHRSLPILVDSLQMAEDYAAHLSARFYLLAAAFLAGSANDHRARVTSVATQGHGAHRPTRRAAKSRRACPAG